MPTVFKDVLERTTRDITCVVGDKNDVGIPAAILTTLTLKLYSLHGAQSIINNRDGQNILNANNVTVDSSGNLVWETQPDDNQILDATLPVEIHRALIEWTWGGGKAGKDTIDIYVTNLGKVT